jgi:hypothetical protein
MSMTVSRARRAGGLAGILFVVAGVVSTALPGSPPKADETAKITGYLADKHSEILASNYLVGIAFLFFLLFAGALRAYLGAADRGGLRPGGVMLAGAAATAALVLAGTAVINGAVFQVAAANDTNLNHALYDVASDLFVAAGFALAAFFAGAAVAIADTKALPSVLAITALVAALVNVVAPVAFFAKSGFFAIGGAYGFIAPGLSLLWVLGTSIMMLLPNPPPRPATRADAGWA